MYMYVCVYATYRVICVFILRTTSKEVAKCRLCDLGCVRRHELLPILDVLIALKRLYVGRLTDNRVDFRRLTIQLQLQLQSTNFY